MKDEKKKIDIKCWEVFKCEKKTCPAFKSKDHRCWLFPKTHCRNQIQGKFIEKMEMCLDCKPFKSRIDSVLKGDDVLKDTFKAISNQFKEYKKIVDDRDKELRSISMELAIGITEVFEALRRISSGDTKVRLDETSKIDLINKLKHVVNKTAKEISESQEIMRFIQFTINHTADAAFWMRPDGRFIYVNKAACKSLGYSKSELLSMTIHDIDPLFSKDKWTLHWQEIRKRKSFTFESYHKTKVGKLFPVEITVNFVEFEGSEYNCAFARDITKRKQAQEKLQESEEKYRQLFVTDTNAILVFDAEALNIVDINDAALDMYGYTREEFLNMKRMDIKAELGETEKTIHKTLSGEIVQVPLDYHMKKDGTTFPVEVSAGSFVWKGRQMVFEVVKDITERVQAEKELKKSHENLRALSSRITEVQEDERKRLARELHDQVGQPLTALSINLDFLIEQLSNKSKTGILERLYDSKILVKKTMKLIRNTMANLRPLILDDYGLASAIHWYSDQFSKRTKIPVIFKGEELRSRLLPDVETNLFRIVQESLTNIAKHANATEVIITLKEEGRGNVKLTITDDGVGFDSERNNRRGLGLIGMRERAEALGGTLRVESSPGKGTQVIVEIKRINGSLVFSN